MNLVELALAHSRNNGTTVAIRMGEQQLTYSELLSESARVATGLEENGVRRGDRVLMFSANNVEYLVVYLATARLGAIFTPVHASFQANELAYVLKNATPIAVVTQASLLPRLERVMGTPGPTVRITIGDRYPGALDYNDLGRNGHPAPAIVDVRDDEPALICYTSGTTDSPHPVTRSHAIEIWNAQSYAEVWDYRFGDRALVTLPLSWVWGLSTLALALLSVGATVVLHVDFDPVDMLAEVEASRITLFAGTMSMYTALLTALDEHRYDLSSLRRLYRGGEPINNEVVDALTRRLGVALTDAYAATEAAPILAVDPVRDLGAPPGTAGRLVPGARIRIVDDADNELPAGEVGEALLGGPGVMLGYWNEPRLTAERMTADGWFRSGDLLVEGSDGYYFVVGRSADVIIRNGAKIAPAEVESALAELSGIRDAVAVGVPDDEFGESIVAFLLLETGCVVSVDDVYDHLSDRIARFKLPSHIYFVDDLPLRLNEKRDRAMIRRRALETITREEMPFGSGVVNHGRAASHLRLV